MKQLVKSELESLSAKCNQKELFSVGEFTLKEFDSERFWLEHDDGEGTTINQQDFYRASFEMLEKLFMKNF